MRENTNDSSTWKADDWLIMKLYQVFEMIWTNERREMTWIANSLDTSWTVWKGEMKIVIMKRLKKEDWCENSKKNKKRGRMMKGELYREERIKH